jgi:hypothetical protein
LGVKDAGKTGKGQGYFPVDDSDRALRALAGEHRRLRHRDAGAGGEQTVTEKYVVDGADGAWLGGNGDLTVCLFGQAPRRPSADFSVWIPAGDLAAPGDAGPLVAYRVPANRITTLCGQPPEGARAIPVEFVAAAGDPGPKRDQDWEQAPEQDWEQVPEQDREQNPEQEQDPEHDLEQDPEQDWEPGPEPDQDLVTMSEYMDRDAPGAKIYLFEEAETDFGATVIYRHETPLPGGMRFTRLVFPVKETQPDAALIFLVPVTLAVDVFVFYLCVQNPTACSSL